MCMQCFYEKCKKMFHLNAHMHHSMKAPFLNAISFTDLRDRFICAALRKQMPYKVKPEDLTTMVEKVFSCIEVDDNCSSLEEILQTGPHPQNTYFNNINHLESD